MPARSNASHEVSSSSRCCGSIASASRGEIPKNAGSKSAASCRNPPSWTYGSWPLSGSGSKRTSVAQPRLVGYGVAASPPRATSSHSSSGVLTPPG